jgi:hypothetical protein
MATCYDTLLECKSNNQLLQKIDPRDIIKKTSNTFISCKDGIYYFESAGGALHDDIVELSKEYPDEVFEARIWNPDMYASELRTIAYKAGIPEVIKTEPNYGFHTAHLEKILGKETIGRFMEIAMRYIKAYDKLDNTPEFDEAIKKEREDKIYSFTTVHVENDKFRIEATQRTYSLIEVKGYVKEISTPTPIWKEIKEERISNRNKEQLNDFEEAEPIPEE